MDYFYDVFMNFLKFERLRGLALEEQKTNFMLH